MLPPKPRLLRVMEIVDQPQAKQGTKTNERYPHRRGLERATQSFIIYLLVSSRFADGTETKPATKVEKPPRPPAATSR